MFTGVRSLLIRSVTLRTFGVVMVLAGGAKIIGLLKEVAVAAKFGISPSIDAYIFLFNILSTPVSIWFGTIFSTLVPYLIRLERQDSVEALRFRSEFVTLSIGLGALVGILTGIGLYAFVAAGISGLGEEASRHARDVLPWLWVLIPLLFVAQYGASCLMAKNLHANTFYEGAPALVILVAALILPSTIGTLAAATIAGAALQMFATLFSVARCGSLQRPAMPGRSRSWPGFWPSFAVMAGVQTLQSSAPLIDQLIAAQLPSGSLAQFSYALRVQALFLTLIALAVPRVLLPALASIAHLDQREINRFVMRWALLLGGTGVMVSLVISIFSEPIVRILYERGSFSAQDTVAVAAILSVMIWQLPFYTLSLLYSQQHISSGRYSLVAAIAIGTLITKLSIGLVLVWKFGLLGLAASGAVVFAFQASALFLASRSGARTSEGEAL